MASPQARRSTDRPNGPRRLVPVGVAVAVYVVAGALWVVGSGPVADLIVRATSVGRWVVVLVLGVLFVAITAVVLGVSMQRRAQRLHTAHARTREADERTLDANERTHDANARTHDANERTHDANERTQARTRQLVASEDRNRLQATALSGTTAAVMVTARDGTIEWVNEAFATMSGYTASEAIGSTPRLLRSGKHDEDFYGDLWDTILAGEVWHGLVVNRRSNDELYTVSQTITPVVCADGSVHNFVATLEDVTERERAARALEDSRVRLQSLVDHALDAIVLADDQGRYVEVNPSFCALTGYTHEELLGLGPADLAVTDRQAADVVSQFDEFLQAGTESGSFALRHKHGHVVETEYRAVSNIQPGVHLSVLRDVTERNAMLRALSVAESEFRDLAEKAADIVAKLRVDGDGRMQVDYVNPAAGVILGYSREHLYEHPDVLLDLFHQRLEDLDSVLDLLPTPDEPVRLATVQVPRADGRLVWLETHSALIDPASEPVTIQLVARDVTARSEMTQALEQALQDQLQAAQELSALNAMKDTFLQSVSHELRTPLTSIMGFAHLLADPRNGLSPGETREFHGRIVSNAQRLQRLLDDLLDVDRFGRADLEPKRFPTDLGELVTRMVDEVGLGDRRVDLDLASLTMGLDGPWVERLVGNLLGNIARHTPRDARVWIRMRATAEGAELRIDDNGPGIPEHDRLRVLEPFQQGAATATSATPGTGVGLSLVKTFAQLHGGDVGITDRPGGGTRVTVTLVDPATDGAVTTLQS